ncbi:MAG: hypothetical protein J5726_06140 [Treponema sp.]|nr:hypothetical protein [Treponema sp.]
MAEITNKKFFTNYAFFLLILVFVFGILIYPVLASKKSWSVNLGNSVQKVLDEYENGRYKVTGAVEINKPITTSCAAYTVNDTTANKTVNAIIIRITTLYGPLPAVFIYDPSAYSDKVVFAGYSSLHGRVRTQLTYDSPDKRREYWQKKVPDIFEGGGED